MNFQVVREFESEVAKFYGAKYGVATDCCTHAIELCWRLNPPKNLTIPTHTYVSVPMTAMKLGIPFTWDPTPWEDFYQAGTCVDAAVWWEEGGFIAPQNTCLSFQYQKHLSLGRGGMILTDSYPQSEILRRMAYDGRDPELPWRKQPFLNCMGYHYYMTPETAQMGLDKLEEAKNTEPRKWTWKDYPDLRELPVFREYNVS